MSREKDDLEKTSGWHIFQEVSKVRIVSGLGVFQDPNPDLTPDKEDGKIPIYVRSSESFEIMRYRATKARIDQFIQENKTDLKDSGISPESMGLISTVASGFFTEKTLREFIGGDEEEEEVKPATSSTHWSQTSFEDEAFDDIPEQEWIIGKGWTAVKKATGFGGGSSKRSSWGKGYGGSYNYEGYTSYGYNSTWSEKPKPYRTLSTQLKDVKTAVEEEMNASALRVLENPADLARVILVKVIDKIDVLDPAKIDKWKVDQISSDIMVDIRRDLGYNYSYDGLVREIRVHVEAMVNLISKGVTSYLVDADTPEKLLVDLGVLLDVTTKPDQEMLQSLFGRVAIAKEEAAEEEAKASEKSNTEFHESDLEVFSDDDSMRVPDYHTDPSVWGRLRIIEHPLIPSAILRKRTVTYKATDIGTHMGRLDRILTDQRIFKEMRPTPTGSLLVDCSGSMGMSSKDIYEVLEHVPGAIIGLYSGSGGGGVLHIIARSGKVAANLDAVIGAALANGGNVVDGPSLEWLATMAKPRIWYSDGGVTGLQDSAGLGLRETANGIMRKGGIGRITNQKKLPAAFKHMRREKNVGKISMK